MLGNVRKGNSEIKSHLKARLPTISGGLPAVRPSNSTIMRLSTKRTLSKLSIPQIFSSTELQPVSTVPKQITEVLVLIESIYGKSDCAILGTVDIMASNRNVLQIEGVELAIANRESYNIDKLCNRTMIKSEDESFHHPWEGQPIGLKFKVVTDHPPTIMRIFNPNNGFDGHVERFSVYINKKCICTDSIPSDYGKHISIVYNTFINKPLVAEFLEDRKNQGPMFPIILSNTVQIELIENLSGKPNIFSVNCFEIVDQFGLRVKLDRIQKIFIENANLSAPLESLLMRKEKNKYVLIQATTPGLRPTIRFLFDKPIRIAFVRTINYVALDAKDSAISKLKITCGERISNIVKCIFSPTCFANDVVATTDTYFIDKKAFKWASRHSKEHYELSAFGPFLQK